MQALPPSNIHGFWYSFELVTLSYEDGQGLHWILITSSELLPGLVLVIRSSICTINPAHALLACDERSANIKKIFSHCKSMVKGPEINYKMKGYKFVWVSFSKYYEKGHSVKRYYFRFTKVTFPFHSIGSHSSRHEILDESHEIFDERTRDCSRSLVPSKSFSSTMWLFPCSHIQVGKSNTQPQLLNTSPNNHPKNCFIIDMNYHHHLSLSVIFTLECLICHKALNKFITFHTIYLTYTYGKMYFSNTLV